MSGVRSGPLGRVSALCWEIRPHSGTLAQGVEQRPYCVDDPAAHVLGIEIDALRTGLGQTEPKVRIPMIPTGVEAQLLHGLSTLLQP